MGVGVGMGWGFSGVSLLRAWRGWDFFDFSLFLLLKLSFYHSISIGKFVLELEIVSFFVELFRFLFFSFLESVLCSLHFDYRYDYLLSNTILHFIVKEYEKMVGSNGKFR